MLVLSSAMGGDIAMVESPSIQGILCVLVSGLICDQGAIDIARKTIYVSDLTGCEIENKDAATLIIKYADPRRGQVVLDVNAAEVEDLAAKGVKQARRGRKPKSAAV